VYLRALHDRNEVLFFRLVADHLAEMLPIVYTPTVGTAIQQYSHEYRRLRGVYLSVDAPEDVERALRAPGAGAEDVDLVVATDAEAILGIGDWGVGGMEIAVGKLAVYTAAAGIDPARTLAVMLDVGTNRRELLDDPLYLGTRHPRADRTHPAAVPRPRADLQRRRPRHRHGQPGRIARRGQGQRNTAARAPAVVFGSGTAGIGIANQLRDALVADGLTRDEAPAASGAWTGMASSSTTWKDCATSRPRSRDQPPRSPAGPVIPNSAASGWRKSSPGRGRRS